MSRPIEDTIRPEFLRGTDDLDFDADDVPIDDAGSYFTSTNVEGALQELAAAGGAGLTVEELDGTPTVTGVTTIKVSNGTLTDDGGGVVEISTGGGGGGSPTFKGCLITKSSSQNMTDGTYTVVTWQNVIRDDDSFANLGTHNDRVTLPYNAAVEIFAMGFWDMSGTAEREMYIETTGFGTADYAVIPASSTSKQTAVAHAPYIELTAGTDIKLAVAQYSGGTLAFGPYTVDAYLLVRVLELL